MVHSSLTGSPSWTIADDACLKILGAAAVTASFAAVEGAAAFEDPLVTITGAAATFVAGALTVTLVLVSMLPLVLVALQVYLPASSGKISPMTTEATLFLYFTSKAAVELSGRPSLDQVTWSH